MADVLSVVAAYRANGRLRKHRCLSIDSLKPEHLRTCIVGCAILSLIAGQREAAIGKYQLVTGTR
jgi:hypothetical protein